MRFLRSTYLLHEMSVKENLSKIFQWHQKRCFNKEFSSKFAPANIALKFIQSTKEEPVNMKFGNTFNDITKIPGPKMLPIIGSSLSVLKHPDYDVSKYHKFWDSAVREYGPVMRLKLPFLPMVVCSSNADDIETLMKSTLHDPHRTFFGALKKARLMTPENPFKNKTGLLTENGEEWWRLRSKVQTSILRPKSVLDNLPAINDVASLFLQRIDHLQESSGHVPDNFLDELYKWSLESVGRVALGNQFGVLTIEDNDPHSKEMKFLRYITDVFQGVNDSEMGLHIWRFFSNEAFSMLRKANNDFVRTGTEKINEMMQLRYAEQNKTNEKIYSSAVIDKLLDTKGLSDEDVNTMLLDMLLAGMDTTAHATAFTLYLLATNETCQDILRKEVDKVVGKSTVITPEHIEKTPYASQVLRETLRLFPLTLGTGRLLKKDIVMSGYKVPAGTLAYSLNMQVSRNPKYFTRPLDFLPERWHRDRPCGYIHPFASLPFSHGKRVCIGKRIAEQEIHTLLLKIIQKYTISMKEFNEMQIKTQVVIKPDIPLNFEFIPRKK